MKRNRSHVRSNTVMVSETDALTIACCLRAESMRRQKANISNPTFEKRLNEMIGIFTFISDAENCVSCSDKTLETIQVPHEGDRESGPYAEDVPCHSGECSTEFWQRYNDGYFEYTGEGQLDEPPIDPYDDAAWEERTRRLNL